MLVKAIGGLLVIAASGFLGYAFSRDCSRRPQDLRDLQGLVQMLENEISFMSNLLFDAFENICRGNKSDVASIFEQAAHELKHNCSVNASEAWEKAVRDNIGKTGLNKEDEEIVVSFGRMLGNSDMEGQVKNIRLLLGQLNMQESKAEENRKKYETMFKTLGVLGGIALVIVLL